MLPTDLHPAASASSSNVVSQRISSIHSPNPLKRKESSLDLTVERGDKISKTDSQRKSTFYLDVMTSPLDLASIADTVLKTPGVQSIEVAGHAHDDHDFIVECQSPGKATDVSRNIIEDGHADRAFVTSIAAEHGSMVRNVPVMNDHSRIGTIVFRQAPNDPLYNPQRLK